MGLPGFFKLPKHKQFKYKPLFYNPVKEERERRNKEMAREMGISENDLYVSKIQPGIFRKEHKQIFKIISSSNIRLVVIFLILLILAYLLLK